MRLMPLLIWIVAAVAESQALGQPEAQKITLEQTVAEALEKNLALLAERQNLQHRRSPDYHRAAAPQPGHDGRWRSP